MIEVKDLYKNQLDLIDPLPVHHSEKDFLYRMKTIMDMGNSYAKGLWVGDKLIAAMLCFPITDMKTTGIEIWCWFDKEVLKYPIQFAKKSKFLLEEYLYGPYYRFRPAYAQAWMKEDCGLDRWAKFLGFKSLGVSKGLDGCMYHKMRREAA